MKTVVLLFGILIAGAAHAAELKPVAAQPQAAGVNPQVVRTLNSPDMQMSVLKQQLTLLQEKQAKQQQEIAQLREQNSTLQYCLGRLKKEVRELEHPGTSDSSVTVQTESPWASDSCP